MKKMSLLVLLASLLFSTVSMANEEDDALLGVSLSATVWIPLAVLTYAYAPVASVAVGEALAVSAVSGVSVLFMMDAKLGKEIKILVNNDLQNFYNTGELSGMLSSSIKAFKNHDSSLSDSEALDKIAAATNE